MWIGDDLGFPRLNAKSMRTAEITFPSLAWLLPSPLFWKTNEVLVQTLSRNYTYGEMENFLRDLNQTMGWEMRKDNIKYTLDIRPPGVEVHCIYGKSVPTVERIRYKTSVIPTEDDEPEFVYGDGDGSVNIRSLEACLKWRMFQTQPVLFQPFEYVNHMHILRNAKVLDYVENILSSE